MDDITLATALPPYLAYPKFLLAMPLNETEKLIYTLILDRLRLSQANGWTDDRGRVYCYYTIQDLIEVSCKSKSTILYAMKDLEKHGLLDRQRTGSREPNRLYLRLPENNTTQVSNSAPDRCQKQHPNKKKRIKPNYEYVGDSL